MSQPIYELNPFVENKKPQITFLALASLGMAILAAIALVLLLSYHELRSPQRMKMTWYNTANG
jgi:hypothetical protein